MGNEMDIESYDPDLINSLKSGSDDSTWDYLLNTYKKFSLSLTEPPRFFYDSNHLHPIDIRVVREKERQIIEQQQEERRKRYQLNTEVDDPFFFTDTSSISSALSSPASPSESISSTNSGFSYGPSIKSAFVTHQKKGLVSAISEPYYMEIDCKYTPYEFDIKYEEDIIHCCFWEYSSTNIENQNTTISTDPTLFIYMHTNLRALSEAMEIFPVSSYFRGHVLSFDLPGCGRSSGNLNDSMEKCLIHVLDSSIDLFFTQDKSKVDMSRISEEKVEGEATSPILIYGLPNVIFWGRGLSTYPLMKYLAEVSDSITVPSKSFFKSANSLSANTLKFSKTGELWKNKDQIIKENREKKDIFIHPHINSNKFKIKCAVFDSPFTSVENICKNYIDRLHGENFSIFKSILKSFIKKGLSHISSQISVELNSISPLSLSRRVVIPTFILCAKEDDYIPTKEGLSIVSNISGPVSLIEITGRHFTRRWPYGLSNHGVQDVTDFISIHL